MRTFRANGEDGENDNFMRVSLLEGSLLSARHAAPVRSKPACRVSRCGAGAYAPTISCRCSPRPSMPRVTTSPTLRNCGGFMPVPTPGGVPVVTISPGIRVMNCETYEMHFAIEKIMVAVDPVWRRVPLTSSHIESFCTSGISSLVTSHGPTGPNVSCDLPLVH